MIIYWPRGKMNLQYQPFGLFDLQFMLLDWLESEGNAIDLHNLSIHSHEVLMVKTSLSLIFNWGSHFIRLVFTHNHNLKNINPLLTTSPPPHPNDDQTWIIKKRRKLVIDLFLYQFYHQANPILHNPHTGLCPRLNLFRQMPQDWTVP